MKRAIKLVIVLAVLLCLSSCTTLRIKMGENSRFTLLPLSAIEGPVDSYQLITGSFPGYENVAMEAWFTCDENDLQLTMFAPTGQTMGKVFYDGKTISFESSFLPEYRIICMYIVADMQLCFATTGAIGAELSKSDLYMVETYSGNILTKRIIVEDDELVYLIEYQDNGITVTNYLRDYSYTIEFLQ